jgi:hypothetical protein
MNQEKDIGLILLDDLIAGMQIDEEWSVRQARSIKWWGYDLAQTIWVDEPIEDPDISVAKIHAKTEIWKIASDDPKIEKFIGWLNTQASLNGLIYEKERATLSLYCSVYIHRQNIAGTGTIFKAATAIQAADALIKGNLTSEWMHELPLERNSTEHPANGGRHYYDSMTDIIKDYFRPKGDKGSPFGEADFTALKNIDSNPSIMTNAGENGVTAEFPVMEHGPSSIKFMVDDDNYSPGTALFQADNQEKHPQLGSGCLIKLTLPIGENECEVANSLNLLEMSGNNQTHFFGSWCKGPNGITYISFIPAAIYQPNLLSLIFHSYATKAQWATNILLNIDGEQ